MMEPHVGTLLRRSVRGLAQLDPKVLEDVLKQAESAASGRVTISEKDKSEVLALRKTLAGLLQSTGATLEILMGLRAQCADVSAGYSPEPERGRERQWVR